MIDPPEAGRGWRPIIAALAVMLAAFTIGATIDRMDRSWTTLTTAAKD